MNAITEIIAQVHEKVARCTGGEVADYIPELALVDPDLFGIALTTLDGHSHRVGDADVGFTIQSVSKAFVYGLVIDEAGLEATEERVDLEPSGEAFNEISLDPVTSKPMNAMINAGAIAVTGLVPGDRVEDRFAWLRERMNCFAGRELGFDDAVYRSERETGHRNRAIAYMLRSGGVLGDRVDDDLDLYFRQCAIVVTCADLAVMGATLAHGGINPVTGARVISETSVERVLSVMCSSGMYNWSGSWITQVGLPAKSGVGGGVVGVLPGQFAVAVYSPRLDRQGNSLRGIETFRELSRRFNLHLFNTPTVAGQVIRRSYRLDESGSTRSWPTEHRRYLQRAGSSVAIVEVQGDLFFAAVERLSRAIEQALYARTFIVDLSRVGLVDPVCPGLLADLAANLDRRGNQLILVDPNHRLRREDFADAVASLQFVDELDVALEGAEYTLLRSAGFSADSGRVELEHCDLFAGLEPADVDHLRSLMTPGDFGEGDVVCRSGEPGDALFVLTAGSLDVMLASSRGIPVRARVASVSPGACIGEIAVVDGSPRSADVVAVEPSQCYTLTRQAFEQIGIDRPGLYSALLRNILLMNLERLRRNGTTFADRSD